MNHTEAEKLIVSWHTQDAKSIAAIRRRFCIPEYTTLNGYSPVLLKAEDREVFEETARRGFFSFRKAEWTFSHGVYSW